MTTQNKAPDAGGNAEGNVNCKQIDDSSKNPTPQQKWADKNPLKRWAHRATESAIRRGLLTRPDKCDQCGKPGPVDAHHDPDRYNEPLRISAWLCRKCHKAAHKAKAVRP